MDSKNHFLTFLQKGSFTLENKFEHVGDIPIESSVVFLKVFFGKIRKISQCHCASLSAFFQG